jgi:surface protein
MRSTFMGAKSFNANIGKWNTAKVTDMTLMFYGANAFNQKLSWPHTATKPVRQDGMWEVGGWGMDTPVTCT